MENTTTGTVISVRKQWWLKVNSKAFRTSPLDGALFPHIIKIEYIVDGTVFTFRKWFGARLTPPPIGSTVKVVYQKDKPSKARLVMED